MSNNVKKISSSKALTPEQLIEKRSKIAHERVATEVGHSKKKSKFDYLAITMAILMAIITLAGIAIGALTLL